MKLRKLLFANIIVMATFFGCNTPTPPRSDGENDSGLNEQDSAQNIIVQSPDSNTQTETVVATLPQDSSKTKKRCKKA